MVSGGRPLVPDILGQPASPFGAELRIAKPRISRTPSKKVQLTLIGSRQRAFQ